MAQITLKELRDAEREMMKAAREYFKPGRVIGKTGDTTVSSHKWGFGVSANFIVANDEEKTYATKGFSLAT